MSSSRTKETAVQDNQETIFTDIEFTDRDDVLASVSELSIEASTLSALGLDSELYFSLSYQSTRISKKGILATIKKQKEELDIDIACALYDGDNVLLELVWYKKLRDSSEAIRHHGDELRGTKTKDTTADKQQKENTKPESNKEHDNSSDTSISDISETRHTQKKKYRYQLPSKSELETIHLKLNDLPQAVCHVALLVSSFQHVPLSRVNSGAVELEDVEGNSILYSDFSNVPASCASFWVASFDRNNAKSVWTFVNKATVLAHNSMDTLAANLFLDIPER